MPAQTLEESPAEIDAFRRGDQQAFETIAERHRRALRVHCYQMLGSFDDAEDLTQETLFRAWNKRETFAGRSKLRTWLYSIATHACLDAKDAIERRPATVTLHRNGPDSTADEIMWLQPFPDQLLDTDSDPESGAIDRETVELTFIAAMQHLTPQGRAVLILRDVLGWSAKQAAETLDISVASANSALQRARDTMRERLPRDREQWPGDADLGPIERTLIERFMAASENVTREAWIELIADDARFSMLPEPGVWEGNECMVDAWLSGGLGDPEWGELRTMPVRANGTLAFANYVRVPGDDQFRLFALDVVRVAGGKIAEITGFGKDALSGFDLPPTL